MCAHIALRIKQFEDNIEQLLSKTELWGYYLFIRI